MNGIKRSCLIVAVVVGLISETRDTSAQFSASYQTNIINGVTNNWSGQYLVGVATSNNALLILNGGVLSVPTPGGVLVGLGNVLVTDPGSALLTGYLSLFGRDGDGLVVSNGGTVITRSEGDIYGLGTGSTGTACSATVIGTGSVWSNMSSLYVGYYGAGSSLVIRNGGVVVASQPGLTFVGNDSSSSNTSVLITDPGSVWSNNANLYVGNGSEGNSLVISNGGKVFSGPAYLGKAETANGNHVEVVGPGSIWFNKASIGGFRQLEVGRSGSGNSLVIDKGGQVFDGSGSIGFVSNSVNNSVWVTDSGSVWSNTSDLSVGSSGVGNTLVISNGGKVFNGLASIGSQASSGSNRVRVVDNGIWQNGEVRVGDQGSSNSLVVGGGNVSATLLTVGLASSTCDNLLELDSGTITVAGPRTNRPWTAAAPRAASSYPTPRREPTTWLDTRSRQTRCS